MAHQMAPGFDSVDSSRAPSEIRWDEESRYDDAILHANAVWNALGRVKIAPDKWNTVKDLEWKDTHRCDVTWVGEWVWNPGADNIYMNTCKLSNADPKAVASHELGHALGLDHSFASQLMGPVTGTCDCITPQDHDMADYYDRWGRAEAEVPCRDRLISERGSESGEVITCPI